MWLTCDRQSLINIPQNVNLSLKSYAHHIQVLHLSVQRLLSTYFGFRPAINKQQMSQQFIHNWFIACFMLSFFTLIVTIYFVTHSTHLSIYIIALKQIFIHSLPICYNLTCLFPKDNRIVHMKAKIGLTIVSCLHYSFIIVILVFLTSGVYVNSKNIIVYTTVRNNTKKKCVLIFLSLDTQSKKDREHTRQRNQPLPAKLLLI